MPDRFLALGVDRVEVSQRSRCVDVLTVHGRRGPRSSKGETPRRAVRKCPEFLAAGQLEHAQRVPDLLVPVEQIDLAVADGGAAEAGAQRHGPQHRRACVRPDAQQAALTGGAVRVGSVDRRPICRERGGHRQRHDACDEGECEPHASPVARTSTRIDDALALHKVLLVVISQRNRQPIAPTPPP